MILARSPEAPKIVKTNGDWILNVDKVFGLRFRSVATPLSVESAFAVVALVSVSTEVVTKCLDQICGRFFFSHAFEVGKGGGEGEHMNACIGKIADDMAEIWDCWFEFVDDGGNFK